MSIKNKLAKIISKAVNIDVEEVIEIIEVPTNKDMGDFSFPCFRLAKSLKQSPTIIANELLKKIEKEEFLQSIRVVGAYLNFYTNKEIYVKELIEEVLKDLNNYGKDTIGNGKTVVVDYSSPNIAKPFHIGHLRSTVIGNALYKIHQELGYNCVGINHLGDWGTQFGKLIVAYKNWGSKEAVEKDGISELMRIYVKFHDEAKSNEILEDEARSWFVKMQENDKEALDLWKWFYEISMKEFERVYKMLDVKFDAYTGESFYNDKMDIVIKELKDKNVAKISEGALIVDLEEENMSPCLIVRKDGGTLYATRDLAAVFYRKKHYNFDKCIYLTALDQNLHFKQWIKVVEKLGYDWHKNLIHVPFGLVSLDTGKLSTRNGNVVLMEELLNSAINETLKIINEKNPELENKYQIANEVGIGAVIFNDLYNSRIKDVVFSWDRMLNFDGETGPYVQYAHARACSVLEKGNFKEVLKNLDYSVLTDIASIDLLKNIEMYPSKIKEACNKLEPSILTRHLVNIAQSFNKFYYENKILVEEKNIKEGRLVLVYITKVVIFNGLKILNIKVPEKM